MALLQDIQSDISRFWAYILAVLVVLSLRRLFAVPAELAHLPRVPVLPTLWSYAKCEAEDIRTKKLILPFATEKGESLVVIYALGRWMVHVLDNKIAKEISNDIIKFQKEIPPDGMLLWRFVGHSNIVLSNGESWKRHSRVVKAALNRNLPIETFGMLTKRLFTVMGSGGVVHWDDLTMRFTLDAVGTTALGHDFNAIMEATSPFIKQYIHIMESIANPAFLVFPTLEKLFPRVKTMKAIDSLVEKFLSILQAKKENKGNDMISYMLEEPGITDKEYRDNVITFFIAGHDTTSGAISSLCYYLAKHPEIQARARAEVTAAMVNNKTGEPTLSELREMPYVQACIRESLRVNSPISLVVPRTCSSPVTLVGGGTKEGVPPRSYTIPANTSIIYNLTAIHFNERYWSDPKEFRPERYLSTGNAKDKDVDANMWLPFALGARQCPARNFAMHEQRVLGAMLLREWEWTLPPSSPHTAHLRNGFSPFSLSLPKNLYLDFKRRDAL